MGMHSLYLLYDFESRVFFVVLKFQRLNVLISTHHEDGL